MRTFVLFLSICAVGFFLLSCEKEFIPEVANQPDQIVVEGYIEAGPSSLPPYIILTKTLPFFSAIGRETLNEIFLRDAQVSVEVDGESYEFEEICWTELDAAQRELLQQVLGQFGNIDDSVDFEFCLYIDPSFRLQGEVGKTYSLRIQTAEGQELRAQTSIPPHVGLDSLRFKVPAGEVPDTLKELRAFISDPSPQIDFYRYFTSTNGSPFLAPLGSVADDKLFDGQSFEFPLPQAETFDAEVDEFFGLYRVGDTVDIKWANIDQPHFDFWNTLEFNVFNQGPFSNYTRIQTNVEGGLGIWGGYSISFYTIVVE